MSDSILIALSKRKYVSPAEMIIIDSLHKKMDVFKKPRRREKMQPTEVVGKSPSGGMPFEIDRLACAISEVSDAVEMLRSKIISVLSSRPEENPPETDTNPPTTELGGVIRGESDRLYELRRHIASVAERIEL